MFFLATAAVFLLAAAVQAGPEQQLRVVRTQVRCGDGQRCPKDNEKLISGELRNITYGQKNQPLSADFVVDYHPDGTVDYTVTAKGSSSNPVNKSLVVIGSGGPNCQWCELDRPSVVSFTGLQFNQCGYTQTFDGNKVHRTIVVKVRHHFDTGASDSNGNPIHFIGYRDITVDFWLEPENITDVVIAPPVQRVHDELEVCVELTHQLVTLNSGWPYFWHVKINATNYVPQALGLGFNLERCWVVPYLKEGLSSTGLGPKATFLVDSVLDQDVLFDQPIIPHYSAIPGVEYQFSFGQVTSGAVDDSMLADDKKHQVHCSVCLCKLNSQGADACLDITAGNINGRSAFQGKSFRPLFEEAVLVAGYARQV